MFTTRLFAVFTMKLNRDGEILLLDVEATANPGGDDLEILKVEDQDGNPVTLSRTEQHRVDHEAWVYLE